MGPVQAIIGSLFLAFLILVSVLVGFTKLLGTTSSVQWRVVVPGVVLWSVSLLVGYFGIGDVQFTPAGLLVTVLETVLNPSTVVENLATADGLVILAFVGIGIVAGAITAQDSTESRSTIVRDGFLVGGVTALLTVSLVIFQVATTTPQYWQLVLFSGLLLPIIMGSLSGFGGLLLATFSPR